MENLHDRLTLISCLLCQEPILIQLYCLYLCFDYRMTLVPKSESDTEKMSDCAQPEVRKRKRADYSKLSPDERNLKRFGLMYECLVLLSFEQSRCIWKLLDSICWYPLDFLVCRPPLICNTRYMPYLLVCVLS